MTAPIELLLTTLRARLPTNLVSVAQESSLSDAISTMLPLLENIEDKVPGRNKLSKAPLFPCKLKLFEEISSSVNKKGNTKQIIHEQPVALWSAVLPWETALGLSYVNLEKYEQEVKEKINSNIMQKNNNNKENEQQEKLLEEKKISTTEKEKRIPCGMLFASSGILDANIRGNYNMKGSGGGGGAVKWEPMNFWSGGIIQPIDVVFLNRGNFSFPSSSSSSSSPTPLPEDAIIRRRRFGPLSNALKSISEKENEGFVCLKRNVGLLDPFHSSSSVDPKQNNNNNKTHFEFDCPRSSFAPYFCLELPKGTIDHLSSSSNYKENTNLQIQLDLCKEICDDIDRKMLVTTNFLPVINGAATTILGRLCAEVLQPGASLVRQSKSSSSSKKQKGFFSFSGFGDGEESSGSSSQAEEENENLWSSQETNFLCLCTRLNIGQPEQVMATWEVLANKMQREEESGNNNNNDKQQQKDDFVGSVLDNGQIEEMLKDNSVWLPHSIHSVVGELKKK